MTGARELDYKQMVKDIDAIMEKQHNFLFDMDCKQGLHEKPDIFNQEDAVVMARILGQIYMIAHAIDCSACQGKYVKKGVQ